MSARNLSNSICRRGLIVFLAILFVKLIVVAVYFGFYVDSESFYPIVGPDELTYYFRSQVLAVAWREYGLAEVADNYYQYTGSKHFLFYFLIAPFFYTPDPHFYFIIVKSIIYSLTCVYLYKICNLLYSGRVAIVAVLCFFLYIPMQVISLSFMRDDIMLFCIVGGVFYSVRGGGKSDHLLFLVFAILLFSMRMHAAMALVVFFLVYNLNLTKRGGWKVIMTSIVIVSYVFYSGLDFIARFFERVSVNDILLRLPYEVLRFSFSPMPTQVSSELPSILPFWYVVGMMSSFLAVIAIPIYVIRKVNVRFLMAFAALVFIYITPYVGIGNVGFRQQSLIVPLIFALFVVPIVMRYRPRQAETMFLKTVHR